MDFVLTGIIEVLGLKILVEMQVTGFCLDLP